MILFDLISATLGAKGHSMNVDRKFIAVIGPHYTIFE